MGSSAPWEYPKRPWLAIPIYSDDAGSAALVNTDTRPDSEFTPPRSIHTFPEGQEIAPTNAPDPTSSLSCIQVVPPSRVERTTLVDGSVTEPDPFQPANQHWLAVGQLIEYR